jgi:hypothetical protein
MLPDRPYGFICGGLCVAGALGVASAVIGGGVTIWATSRGSKDQVSAIEATEDSQQAAADLQQERLDAQYRELQLVDKANRRESKRNRDTLVKVVGLGAFSLLTYRMFFRRKK